VRRRNERSGERKETAKGGVRIEDDRVAAETERELNSLVETWGRDLGRNVGWRWRRRRSWEGRGRLFRLADHVANDPTDEDIRCSRTAMVEEGSELEEVGEGSGWREDVKVDLDRGGHEDEIFISAKGGRKKEEGEVRQPRGRVRKLRSTHSFRRHFFTASSFDPC